MSLDKYVPGPSPETKFFEGLKISEKFNADAQRHLRTISHWSRSMSLQKFAGWVEHQSSTDPDLQTPEEELLQNRVFKALLEPVGGEMLVLNDSASMAEMKVLLDGAEVNTEMYLRSISERLDSGHLSETEILASLQALAKDLRSWLDDN